MHEIWLCLCMYVCLCVVSQLFSNGSSLYFNNDMICDNPSNLIYPYSYYYNILTSFLETHTRRGSMCVPWVCNFDLFIISFQWKINYKNLEMFHVRGLSFIFRCDHQFYVEYEHSCISFVIYLFSSINSADNKCTTNQ